MASVGASPSLPTVAGRRINLFSFVLFACMLMLACMPAVLSAYQTTLPDGTVYSAPSLARAGLGMSCSEFWNFDYWNSSWIISRAPPVYNTDAHKAIENLEINSWNPGSASAADDDAPDAPGGIVTSMKTARAKSAAAQDAARAEANAVQLARLDVIRLAAAGGACAGASYVPVGGQFVCAAGVASALAQFGAVLDYPHKWQNAMKAAGGALSESSNSVQEAWGATQGTADELAKMGAGYPQYNGAARDTWDEWEMFASDAIRFSKNGSMAISAEAAATEDALAYAQTYRTLHRVEALCERPIDPLPFNDTGSVSNAINSLSSGGSNTLWARAWVWQAKLTRAAERMEDERILLQSMAEDRLKEATATMSDLTIADWSEDNQLPIRSLDDEVFVSSWDALGTYNSRVRGAQDAYLSAKASDSAARDIARARKSLWQVRSMLLDANTTANANSAILRAAALLTDMNTSTDEERQKAKEETNALEQRIAAGSAAGKPYALQAALAALARANSQFENGENAEARRIGKRYSHYRQASKEAAYGLELLDSGSGAGADLSEMKSLLDDLRVRLTWANALGVDVSEFRAGYDNFETEVKSGWIREESAEQIRAQIRALNLHLATGLWAQEEQYQQLDALASALLAYYPGAMNQWRADMKVWRSADDEWSDQSLKNPAGLRSALASSQKRLEQQRASALQSALCENAQWSPRQIGVESAGTQTDLGGIWSSHNPMEVGQNTPLQIACPFDWNFAWPEVNERSAWVQSASSSDGQIHISLSEIGAGDELKLDIRSMQTPAIFSAGKCVASVDSGALIVRSAHKLRVSGSPASVQTRLLWTSSLPLSYAKMSSADGETIRGKFVDASTDASTRPLPVVFSVPQPAASSEWESVMQSASAPGMTRGSFSATAASGAGMVDVGYVLTVEGLPDCDEAVIYMQESSDALTQLKVKAADVSSDTEIVQLPLAGHPQWVVKVSPLPLSGKLLLAVSYRINDSKQWVELSLPLVEAQAKQTNNAAALSFVENARTFSSQSNWVGAVEALEKARVLLDNQAITLTIPPAESERFNLTLSQAKDMQQKLTNLSASVRSSDLRPDWAVEAMDWRAQLQAMLDDVDGVAMNGGSLPSIKSMRTLVDKINTKSMDLAEKDYFAINNELNSLRVLDERPEQNSQLDLERSLLAARTDIQTENGVAALSKLLSAHNQMSTYKAVLKERMAQSAGKQKQQAASLLEQAALTQEELDAYLKALGQLDSAGSHAFQPALSLTAAKSLQTELKKASVPTMDSPLPDDLKLAAKSVATQQTQLVAADAALVRVRKPLGEGAKSLQAGANTSARLVQSYLGEIANRPKLADTPQAAALQSDYANMQDMLVAGQWSEAIVAGESIQLRAKRLVDSDKGAAEPPYAVIGLTILLVIGIGYILLRPKPPKERTHVTTAPKTLTKVAGA